MRNGIGLQQYNQGNHPKEGNEQKGGVRLSQGVFQQIIPAEKKNDGFRPSLFNWHQQNNSLFTQPFPDIPLPNTNLLKISIPLFVPTEPLQKIRRPYFVSGGKSIEGKEGFPVALENIQDLERFDPDRFVNREVELKTVDKRIAAFRRGEVVKQPLINFWGVADIGKTWLLKEIERRYQYDPAKDDKLQKPTCTVYYDFDQPDLTVTAVAQSLLHTLADNLTKSSLNSEKQNRFAQLRQSKKVEDIINFIIALSAELVFIFLLDTTEHVDDTLWEKLELKLFEPLLKSNKILLIVTGRNRAPRWKRVEVRRRATPIEKSQVQPFDQKTTTAQLHPFGLSPSAAQEIFDDSAGAPGLTTMLGYRWQHFSEADYLRERTKAWNTYIKDIFDHLSQLSETFVQMVTAVIPLRYYRTQALRNMLEKQNYYGDTSDVFLLRTLRKLDKESHLVWWDDHQNAYVTALAARRILNRRLQIEKPAKFVKLHTIALEMYQNWAREYETSLPAYFPELLFHEATIYKAQNLVPDSKIEPAGYIKMVNEMGIDNRDILHRRLEQDTELQSLVPELFNKIFSHLETSVGSVEG